MLKINKDILESFNIFILKQPANKQFIHLCLLGFEIDYIKCFFLNFLCLGLLYKKLKNIKSLLDEIYKKNPIEAEKFYKFYLYCLEGGA